MVRSSTPATPASLMRHGLHGITDLYRRDSLATLDARFVDWLAAADAVLAERLAAARLAPDALVPKQEAELLVALAPWLEQFVADLFGIAQEARTLGDRHRDLAALFEVKRLFVQRRAFVRIKPAQAQDLDGAALARRLAALGAIGVRGDGSVDEAAFAVQVHRWLQAASEHVDALQAALEYAAWALHTDAGRAAHGAGTLFRMPARTDPAHLIPTLATEEATGVLRHRVAAGHEHWRDGFALGDAGMDTLAALDQSHYCVRCHETGTDSCRQGLREKAGPEAPQKIVFRRDSFGHAQAGCPLGERISEFNALRTQGHLIGALAAIVVENPTAAGTGHRICNDCMKACIYTRQKQQPVDIPQAESRTLKDVLALPWGFEIYSLLTRWNPLNLRLPLPRPASGRTVLVVGLGPAGITLAHHLMNDGHAVVAVDRWPLTPLPARWTGLDGSERVAFEAVRNVEALQLNVDERQASGFGGTAETGIVGSRWDKNNLTLLRLLLERRGEQFALAGGLTFGRDLDWDDVAALGFDHVALCTGAPLAQEPLLSGRDGADVHRALDFLRTLQLDGAIREDSTHPLAIRLPIVVIGGGLTAIDAATESLAYYALQVERMLRRHEAGQAPCAADGSEADEWLQHARALRAERAAASREGRPARISQLWRGWGGVTIAYRRRLVDSPAYTLNHEEVEKALQEGVCFAESLSPRAIARAGDGRVCAVDFQQQPTADAATLTRRLPAGTVILAVGSQPDVSVVEEGWRAPSASPARISGAYFQPCDAEGRLLEVAGWAKPSEPQVLLAGLGGGRWASFYGDMNPAYAGNVVRALASAKQGAPVVTKLLRQLPVTAAARPRELACRLGAGFREAPHEPRPA